MLKLLIGKAGSGKTAAIMEEIRRSVELRRGGCMLIVPEQYSHEAERELCARCGDGMSLYAEVFSFTGLARRVMSQVGGGAAPFLDKGGRLLCMALALDHVSSRLKMYSAASGNPEMQRMLLHAVDEVKSAAVSSELLMCAAEGCEDALGDKLRDLALILEAYDAAAANGHADPADRLTVLASQLPESPIGAGNKIYIDGFIDFTCQERNVIREMLRSGAEVTVCLTVDRIDGGEEVFSLSRRAARQLIDCAKELGVEESVSCLEDTDGENGPDFFRDRLFGFSTERYAGENGDIMLCSCESMMAECELAAAKALSLVRDRGCRWRDIAVAVRGFDEYKTMLESIFRHYGVPLYVSKKSDMLSKPLPAMISGVYEIIDGGWDVDDVVSYMRTGLSGLTAEECDTLENYIFKWQLRENAWLKEEDWHQHPEGYGAEYDEAAKQKLREINALRRRLSGPILALRRRSDEASDAAGQAEALADFFAEMGLAQKLSERVARMSTDGRESLAAEYAQLWDLTVSALEQCSAILGDTAMDREQFGKLFTLMLSQYDVGTIPVSLDRVSAGDFDRMRRRNIRHLIVLGASEDRLPGTADNAGMFSEEERRRLLELDIDLGGGGESELWREFSLIYHCLSLPSESLCMSYAASDSEGNPRGPAFVLKRAKVLFGIEEEHVDLRLVRTAAPAPALSLAAHAVKGGSAAERAAAEYFRIHEPGRYAALSTAAEMSRGRLSMRAVRALYGTEPGLSASRIDKFASCKFSYFCQYGLKAKPYEPAGFKPPEIGIFMHFVLEHTAKEVKEKGGFAKVDDKDLERITDKWVAEYVHTELNDMSEKTERFRYLFRRLSLDARQIVADTAAELRRSEFEPLSFELNFGDAEKIPPVELGEGAGSLRLTGIADRVDGWVHDGKLYLRVADYKTGRKEFSLSDVWYGMGLQMLLYLFALDVNGELLYGMETVPAGMSYIPARNDIISVSGSADSEEIEKKRSKERRRSGIVLDDPQVKEAWESGAEKLYIPIRYDRSRKPTSDSLVSAEHLGLLARHVEKTLCDIAGELKAGSINADPYYRGQQENACLNCDYFDACHFADGENSESFRYLPKLSPDSVWGMMEGGGSDA